MAQKDARIIQRELAKPFAPEDLEWRLQRTVEIKGDMVGIAVPYVTNRAIQNRLDSVVGPENWYNDFRPWHRFTMKVKSDYYALEYASDTKIARFPAIRDKANPYDEEWQLYLEERETEKMRVSVAGNKTLRRLFNQQKGLCALCGGKLTLETGGRCHKYRNGTQTANFLVHPNCHLKIHTFQPFQPAYCGSNRL